MVTFSVYYDGQFWVGVLEIQEYGELRAIRVVFGPEPTDPQVYAFLMANGSKLLERAAKAPAVPYEKRPKRVNPQRAAKLAARAAKRVSSRSTASQEALRLELESRGR